MTLDVRLRPYRPQDLADTVAVWRASKRTAFPYVAVQQSYTLEDDTGYFRDVVATECEVWLAEVDGCTVGLMAMKGSLIDQLFVDVDFQGQGVGTVLLAKAREHSPAGLQLYTFRKNVTGREFYEKHGFTAVRFGISPPPEGEPDVRYAWQPPWMATSFRHSSRGLIIFRPLVASDAQILGQYFLGLSDEARRFFGPHPLDQATADLLCAQIDYVDTIRMLATAGVGVEEAEEQVVAYFILQLGITDDERDRYHRVGVSLDPQTDCTVAPSVAGAFQGQGVGSRLMVHLIRVARRLGRKRMVLLGGAQAANHRAVHFYHKHGFRTVGTFEWPAGCNNYDMLLEL